MGMYSYAVAFARSGALPTNVTDYIGNQIFTAANTEAYLALTGLTNIACYSDFIPYLRTANSTYCSTGSYYDPSGANPSGCSPRDPCPAIDRVLRTVNGSSSLPYDNTACVVGRTAATALGCQYVTSTTLLDGTHSSWVCNSSAMNIGRLCTQWSAALDQMSDRQATEQAVVDVFGLFATSGCTESACSATNAATLPIIPTTDVLAQVLPYALQAYFLPNLLGCPSGICAMVNSFFNLMPVNFFNTIFADVEQLADIFANGFIFGVVLMLVLYFTCIYGVVVGYKQILFDYRAQKQQHFAWSSKETTPYYVTNFVTAYIVFTLFVVILLVFVLQLVYVVLFYEPIWDYIDESVYIALVSYICSKVWSVLFLKMFIYDRIIVVTNLSLSLPLQTSCALCLVKLDPVPVCSGPRKWRGAAPRKCFPRFGAWGDGCQLPRWSPPRCHPTGTAAGFPLHVAPAGGPLPAPEGGRNL